MKSRKSTLLGKALPVISAFVLGAFVSSFVASMWYKSIVPKTSADWRTYTDPKGDYTLEYPSYLTPSATAMGVNFNDSESTLSGFSVSSEATSVSADDTLTWLSLQSTYMGEPLFVVQNSVEQKFVVVGGQVQVDSDNGIPIYATVLNAVQLYNDKLYKVSWPNQSLTQNGDLPQISESILKLLESFTITVPEISAEDKDWHEANTALAQFLGLLHEGTYAAAASRFGGDMSQLQDWNPDLGSTDDARLWQRGCEQNGLQCLAVESITPVEVRADGTRVFSVLYEHPDEPVYNQHGQVTFSYTFEVKKGNDGLYYVQTLPPYQE